MLANSKVVARRAAVASTRSATPLLPRRLVVRKFKVGCSAAAAVTFAAVDSTAASRYYYTRDTNYDWLALLCTLQEGEQADTSQQGGKVS